MPGTHPSETATRLDRRAPFSMVALVVVMAIVVAVCASCSKDKPPRFVPEPGPGAFRGFGTWVDVFEEGVWNDPEGAVEAMRDRGIQTVFLQASNYGREASIAYPEATARFLDAAHEEGIHVVGWYFPGWSDVDDDYRHVIEAVRFRSDAGQGFDAFGIDIEPGLVADPAERTDALLRLSRKVRAELGPSYPLGAITPNPMRIAQETGYWPDFPYAQLSQIYDAFVPMDYFGAVPDAGNKQGAYRYTMAGIREVREGADRLGVPIHVAGGLAEDVTPPELEGFLRAVDKGDAVGFSLYTYSTTGENDWPLLEGAAADGLTVDVGIPPSTTTSAP